MSPLSVSYNGDAMTALFCLGFLLFFTGLFWFPADGLRRLTQRPDFFEESGPIAF